MSTWNGRIAVPVSTAVLMSHLPGSDPANRAYAWRPSQATVVTRTRRVTFSTRPEHRSWRATPFPSQHTTAVPLNGVPSGAHYSSRLLRACLERDGSVAGGGPDEYGCSHSQTDRGSQEDHGPGSREEACHFGSNHPERRRSCRSPGHAEQAPYRFSEQQRPLPCKGGDRVPVQGQLPCELSNLRRPQSQTRGRPQLSAQGLSPRLQQGQDRQGLLSTSVATARRFTEPGEAARCRSAHE